MNTISFQPMMESRPIREIAYEVLKHAIITGEIPAGERIVETDYADRLHISRTPLREALRKLERDGLVEYVLRRGDPRMDLAILRLDYNYNNVMFRNCDEQDQYENHWMRAGEGFYWRDCTLQNMGYTWDYFAPQLLEEDFEFVTVSELAKIRQAKLIPGREYTAFPPKEEL